MGQTINHTRAISVVTRTIFKYSEKTRLKFLIFSIFSGKEGERAGLFCFSTEKNENKRNNNHCNGRIDLSYYRFFIPNSKV